MLLRNLETGLNHILKFKPDEPGSGSGSDEPPAAEPPAEGDPAEGPPQPETFDVRLPDGSTKQVTLEELRGNYVGNAHVTQGLQKIKEDQQAIEAERQRLATREEQVFGALDKVAGVNPPAAPATPAEPPVEAWETDWQRRFDGLDPVSDTYQVDQRRLIEERDQHQRTEILSEVDNRVGEVTSRLDRTKEEIESGVDTRMERHSASESAAERNANLLDATLAQDFAGLEVTPQEKSLVEAEVRQHLGPDKGEYSREAGAWLINAKAVQDAVWATPVLRERLIAQREAAARTGGVEGRLTGEEATEMIPGRLRPAPGSPDEGLMNKVNQFREQTANMAPEEVNAYARNLFTETELKRYQELRRESLETRGEALR